MRRGATDEKGKKADIADVVNPKTTIHLRKRRHDERADGKPQKIYRHRQRDNSGVGNRKVIGKVLGSGGKEGGGKITKEVNRLSRRPMPGLTCSKCVK